MNEAYRVAVRISLIDGVTRGLQLLSRHFKTTDGDAEKLEARMKSIAKLAAAGAGMSAAGMGMLGLLKGPLEEASKYQTLLERLKQFGLGDAAIADAQKFVQAQDIMGASQRDMLRYFVEAQGVFRETGAKTVQQQLAAAKMAAPIMAQMNFAMQGLSEDARASTEAKQMDMLRFVEQAGGLNSPQRFAALMNAGFKAVQSSGGNVDFTQYRQFMARGGTAAMGLSNRSLFADLEPIIGEMKGNTAGTALMTAFNRMNGIVKLPNQVAHELVKNHLWDGSKIVWNSQGGIKTMTGNPLMDAGLYSSDIVEYYRQKILPMYGREHFTDAQRRRENSLIFGRTGGAMFNLIDKQLPTILRSREAFKKAQGITPEYEAIGKTYAGREAALTAKWQTLMLTIGKDGGVLDLATKGLGFLNEKLGTLTKLISNHPGWTKFVVEAATAVGVMLTVSGGLALVGAAFRGLGLAWTVAKLNTKFELAAKASGVLGIAFRGLMTGLLWFARVALGLAVANPWTALAIGLGAAGVLLWKNSKAFHDGLTWLVNKIIDLANMLPFVHLQHIGGGPIVPGGAVPSSHRYTQFHGHFYVDGKEVGVRAEPYITARQSEKMGRPNQGTSTFDPRRAWTPPSLAAR